MYVTINLSWIYDSVLYFQVYHTREAGGDYSRRVAPYAREDLPMAPGQTK